MFDLDFENVWRERGRRQAEQWDRSVAPKHPGAPTLRRSDEQIDEGAVNEMVIRAWDRREIAELELHEHISELVRKCFG